MQFGVLGPLQVMAGDSGDSQVVSAPRLRTVLAVLLWRANQPVPIDELADLVWDGAPPRGAPEAVRALVMRLRRWLEEPAAARIVTRAPGYAIEVSVDELDASRLAALTHQAGAAIRAGRWADARRDAELALSLWRGTPLADVPSQLLRDQWTPSLEQLHLQALAWRVEAYLQEGRHEHMVPELQELIARHPLRENFHGQLMLALARSGRRSEALAAYQEARRILAAELGVEPGAELRQLHEQILSGDISLAAPATPASPEAEPAPAAAPAPRQLPASVRSFIGRQDEALRLEGLVREAARSAGGGAVAISAIDGMAGVGKTALAVYAAHRLAADFPDGHLFIDMHGYTRGHEPRSAGEALEVFLRALGVPPQRVPASTDERAAMFRERLAGTRTMIVLDNAASEGQVRPLLPGSAGCLVLVTSRRRLKGLDEAHVLTLDVLPGADARELFREVAGAGRVQPDDPLLPEIVHLCGQLPLAVRIAAALLRNRPAWTLEWLATLLRGRPTRIGALTDGERDLGAIFDLSYRSLPDAGQLMFRGLGLIPGPDFDAYAAAALAGTDPPGAERMLEDLLDHNLVIQHVPGRYRLHDLIRLYASTLADQDPAPARDAALGRLLDYYEDTAGRADALISRFPRVAPAGPATAHAPALADVEAGQAWLRTERLNLLAALRSFVSHGSRERAVALTANMAALLRNDGPWPEALDLHAAAAATARSLGDRSGEAGALTQLGVIRNLTGDSPGALDALEQASRIYRELGNPLGQANALTQLGELRGFTDDYPGATRDLELALRLFQEADSPLGQANALTRLGNIERYTANLPAAIARLEAALRLFQQVGNRIGQNYVLICVGHARRMNGDFAGASRDLEEALELSGHLGHELHRASTLTALGELRRLTGDYPRAARDLEEGLQIYRVLGNRMGEANALVWLGTVRRITGDLTAAAELLQAAIDTFRRIGTRSSEAWAVHNYAAVIAEAGDLSRAETLFLDALSMAKETEQIDDEAAALEGLGDCHLRRGEVREGVAFLQQALGIFQQLSLQPDADRVRARLGALRRREAR